MKPLRSFIPFLILIFCSLVIAFLPACSIESTSTTSPVVTGGFAPKPLYRDPVYDGAADPVVIWNRHEQKWFMFYTNRRANVAGLTGVSWCHDTPIGIAESADGGVTWTYRQDANIGYAKGEHSYWAPDVIEHDGTYNMYLTYVPGIFENWWPHPRDIIHLTSKNLLDWKYRSTLKLASDKVIDASVFRLPDGTWRMWYKNEKDHSSIYHADSGDLFSWQDKGKVIGDREGEGPKIFAWKGRRWIVMDNWQGLGVYRQEEPDVWSRQPWNLLEEPGMGNDDWGMGKHPDVVVVGGRAYLFYFTHPGQKDPDTQDITEQRRSSIQVVELEYKDGWITCDRNKPTFICLTPEVQYRQISMEDYKDKVAGGWVGQAIGVLWGQWTEGRWFGEIVPFDLEDWYRLKTPPKEFTDKAPYWTNWDESRAYYQPYVNVRSNWEKWTPDKMSNQDDLYIEFMFLHSIMKNGLDVTATEIAEDWPKYLAPGSVWGANERAYLNFKKGIWPPRSGHPHNTPYGDAIDFQIESDLFGLINPGMPRISNAWCDKVGHIMNYGDGVYAEMAMAAMYGEAFFEKDPRKLAEYSLKAIPAESNYAKMVRDVLDLHQKYPDWKDAWKALQPKWAIKDGKHVMGLDVRINGAYVYMGLLYGGGDYWKSMNISMRCGLDSDCNPSSVAGVLGTALGMKGIPEKWAILRDLPIDNKAIKDIYPKSIDWDDILDATVEVGKWNILQNGGYIENDIIFIPYQTLTWPPLEQTMWEELPKKK